MPKRDDIVKDLVRKGFLPSYNCYLVESDFSGAEVNTALSYNKDKNLKKYLINTSSDMHRDLACDLFKLKSSMWTDEKDKAALKRMKLIRTIVKAATFGFFYGSYYAQVAPLMWELVIEAGLKIGDGTLVEDVLMANGIDSKEAFTEHVKSVENIFWNKRFKDYAQWKKDNYQKLVDDGELTTFLGFKFKGYMNKNQSSNFPIQSTSFHLLLYTLVVLHWELKERKMRTRLILQIHDSVVADVPKEELESYVNIVKSIVSGLHKKFPWMEVPMGCEIERSALREEGGTLAKMIEIK